MFQLFFRARSCVGKLRGKGFEPIWLVIVSLLMGLVGIYRRLVFLCIYISFFTNVGPVQLPPSKEQSTFVLSTSTSRTSCNLLPRSPSTVGIINLRILPIFHLACAHMMLATPSFLIHVIRCSWGSFPRQSQLLSLCRRVSVCVCARVPSEQM